MIFIVINFFYSISASITSYNVQIDFTRWGFQFNKWTLPDRHWFQLAGQVTLLKKCHNVLGYLSSYLYENKLSSLLSLFQNYKELQMEVPVEFPKDDNLRFFYIIVKKK